MTRENYRTEGGAKSDNLPFFIPKNLDKGQLRIVAAEQGNTILIEENPHKHPFSWFLTHSSGKLFLSGRINTNDYKIRLLGLETGMYHFRTQGEVYEINVA